MQEKHDALAEVFRFSAREAGLWNEEWNSAKETLPGPVCAGDYYVWAKLGNYSGSNYHFSPPDFPDRIGMTKEQVLAAITLIYG